MCKLNILWPLLALTEVEVSALSGSIFTLHILVAGSILATGVVYTQTQASYLAQVHFNVYRFTAYPVRNVAITTSNTNICSIKVVVECRSFRVRNF